MKDTKYILVGQDEGGIFLCGNDDLRAKWISGGTDGDVVESVQLGTYDEVNALKKRASQHYPEINYFILEVVDCTV